MTSRRRTGAFIAAAAIAGVAAGLVIGLGDDEPDPPKPVTGGSTAEEPRETRPPNAPSDRPGEPVPTPEEDDPAGAEPGPSGPAPGSSGERAAAAAARGYVQALDVRDGAAVCRAFAPGALEALDFPRRRASCPATVEASLGFRKRGMPVWKRSRMTEDVSARVQGDSARVVATVFTVYADVREPTIEDDIVFLRKRGDRWLVAKPSLTIYRAIGDADPPPSVLTPP